MEFEIPLLKNTSFDLSKFDFSFAGIRILNIQSQEFTDYVTQLNPHFFEANFSFFSSVIENIHSQNDRRYAIIKNNYKEFDKIQAYNVYYLLLILCPSGLQIDHIIHFREDDNFVQRAYMSTLENTYHHEDFYFKFDDTLLNESNEYIKLVFGRIDFKNYIGLSIENYINSYNASHLHFAFVALCISLENLISGNQELSYRIKRTISILCGKTKEDANTIFKNISKIYNLRSKIVHGEAYTTQDIYTKIDYLQSLVSRVLIELLIHNISTNKSLDEIITTLGYEQRNLISDDWKEFKINPVTYHKIDTVLQ